MPEAREPTKWVDLGKPFAFGRTSQVVKTGGDYTFRGEVVAAFTKKSGAIRYVVEDERGMLMIFNEGQLRAVDPPPSSFRHFTKEQWFAAPMELRKRFWKETDWAAKDPSPELLAAFAEVDPNKPQPAKIAGVKATGATQDDGDG